MRFSVLSTAITVNAIGALAMESLSEAIKDLPQCSMSAFEKALVKEGCEVKNVAAETFDCMCKHLGSITVTMVTSKVDLNCQANWSSALTNACAQYELYSTTATDFPEATKALASELGAAGDGASPTSTGSVAASGSTAAAGSTSSSKGPAAAATPVMGLVGAAALAGVLF